MRKLKLQVQMSVDGYIATTQSAMDWLTWTWDDKLKDYVSTLHKNVDGLVLGRKLAEGFIPVWEQRLADPKESDDFARLMVESPKLVFTRTMEKSPWNHTTVTKGNLADEINKLKNKSGGDIMAYGGGEFVSGLIRENLIDEYYLFVNPTALGDGMTIFKGLKDRMKLKLVESIGFECGIAVLRYRPHKA